jgi:hypothetical protein
MPAERRAWPSSGKAGDVDYSPISFYIRDVAGDKERSWRTVFANVELRLARPRDAPLCFDASAFTSLIARSSLC